MTIVSHVITLAILSVMVFILAYKVSIQERAILDLEADIDVLKFETRFIGEDITELRVRIYQLEGPVKQ